MKIFYISYTGILEPLGESQVLSYLEKLTKDYSCKIILVTFEKKKYLTNNLLLKKKYQYLLNKSIYWKYFTYNQNNRFLRTLKDILKIFNFFRKYKNDVKIIHCRSYIPALAGYLIKKFYGFNYIFDMRGFWIDEMILNKTIKNKFVIFVLRILEKKLILNSSYIISLSEKSIQYLKAKKDYRSKKFIFIPTCVNTKKFTIKKKIHSNHIVLGCVGTIQSGWFLIDYLINFYIEFKKMFPNSILKIITNDNNQLIKNIFEKNKVKNYIIKSSDSKNIVDEIRSLDLNLMFFSNDFAKLASCPTRLSESLSCGVPIVTNPGLGDMENILKKNDIGVLLINNEIKIIKEAVNKSIKYIKNEDVSNNCRELALNKFDINIGVNKIYHIYSNLS